MVDEMQPYKNNGVAFIHDDRGRFCPVGAVAWLRPGRAEKIQQEMISKGIEDALVRDRSFVPESVECSPSPLDKKPAPELFSIHDRFLSAHHLKRKKAARLLGAGKKLTAPEADKALKAATREQLEALAHIVEVS